MLVNRFRNILVRRHNWSSRTKSKPTLLFYLNTKFYLVKIICSTSITPIFTCRAFQSWLMLNIEDILSLDNVRWILIELPSPFFLCPTKSMHKNTIMMVHSIFFDRIGKVIIFNHVFRLQFILTARRTHQELNSKPLETSCQLKGSDVTNIWFKS